MFKCACFPLSSPVCCVSSRTCFCCFWTPFGFQPPGSLVLDHTLQPLGKAEKVWISAAFQIAFVCLHTPNAVCYLAFIFQMSVETWYNHYLMLESTWDSWNVYLHDNVMINVAAKTSCNLNNTAALFIHTLAWFPSASSKTNIDLQTEGKDEVNKVKPP